VPARVVDDDLLPVVQGRAPQLLGVALDRVALYEVERQRVAQDGQVVRGGGHLHRRTRPAVDERLPRRGGRVGFALRQQFQPAVGRHARVGRPEPEQLLHQPPVGLAQFLDGFLHRVGVGRRAQRQQRAPTGGKRAAEPAHGGEFVAAPADALAGVSFRGDQALLDLKSA
jgi:hypothetical protein